MFHSRHILFYVSLVALSGCRGVTDFSEASGVPDGCDKAKWKVHQLRSTKQDNLSTRLRASKERAPVALGEPIGGADLIAVSLPGRGNGFTSRSGFFMKKNKTTYIASTSDAIDKCYRGNYFFEVEFSKEQVSQMEESLVQTKRIEGPSTPCPESGFRNDLQGLVYLYFSDSTYAKYLVGAEATCLNSSNKNFPAISDEFFELEAGLRSVVGDDSNPYE